MKIALMLINLLAFTHVVKADIESHVEGQRGVLHFSDEVEEAELLEGDFEHMVYDSNIGSDIRSPLGNSRYPYSALGVIEKGMYLASGQYVFKLSEVKASFVENKSKVEGSLNKSQFYTGSNELVYLSGDGRTVVNPEDATFVVFPEFLTKELEEIIDVALWNECKSSLRGNYKGYNCSRRRYVDDGFLKLLKNNLKSCVNAGQRSIGYYQSSEFSVVHNGITADGNHSRSSYHSISRAVDIVEFVVKGNDGDYYTLNYKSGARNLKSKRGKFYKAFRKCWGQVQLRRSPKCKANNMRYNIKRGLPYYGSIGWEDKNHKKHLHISMPHCGGKRGFKKL